MTENEIAQEVEELKGDIKEFRNEFTSFRTTMNGFCSEFRNNQTKTMGGTATWQQKEKLN
ncbi:hypothetical protein BAQ49_02825 [Bacillus proteolyticus]|uniref:Uncharacterized protein n=1 Tax=Bacillus proteolyticus TaxID=2026192 RepID=A0AA44KSX1_9BACI|nr:hypothetical protein [Bacillus proteolyticus]OJE39919.1 hypothetical protein BAQ49_02825 [Bacillus proteolyticus]